MVLGLDFPWVLLVTDLFALWDCLSAQPPWQFQQQDTSGTDRTDIDSSVSYPQDSSCPPSKHTWRSSGLFSWRTPCILHKFWPHSVDMLHDLHTQHKWDQQLTLAENTNPNWFILLLFKNMLTTVTGPLIDGLLTNGTSEAVKMTWLPALLNILQN